MSRFVSVIGPSGCGKTTLIERLVPALLRLGVRVGVLKHSAHPHPLHKPGSDTERFVGAGAWPVGFATPEAVQLTRPHRSSGGMAEPWRESFAGCELVLVEGHKHGSYPKLEVWRPELGPCLAAERRDVLAVVSDAVPPVALPRFTTEQVDGLAGFLVQRFLPRGEADVPRSGAVGQRPVHRLRGERSDTERDAVAIEEPLEIRISTEPVSVTMRTPGDDHRLAVGFLFAEGIVHAIDELGSVAHCGRPGEEGFGNVIDVAPAPGVRFELEQVEASRRGTLITSACGVCGRRSVADLLDRCGTIDDGRCLPRASITLAIERLRDVQRAFASTGGLHAAAAFDDQGALLAGFEDVGRHNAVDKVVGELLYTRRLPAPSGTGPLLLAVSGRTSFEIVQKAAMARIPVVASVSAASSLAIDLAERAGITLAAFVRGERLNVYTHPHRIAGL